MPDAQTSNSDSTSPSLLQQVARQDHQAWQRLTRLYGPLVFHWCRRAKLDPHDAADVLQEVFAAVARAIDTFDPGPNSTFRGWLWTITRNKVRDFYRHESRRPRAVGGTSGWERLAAVPDSPSAASDAFTDPKELNALFRRGLEIVRSEFEDRTWQIFWRTAVQEEPPALVAEEFGITPNAVRLAKSRVLRRLRQELGDLE